MSVILQWVPHNVTGRVHSLQQPPICKRSSSSESENHRPYSSQDRRPMDMSLLLAGRRLIHTIYLEKWWNMTTLLHRNLLTMETLALASRRGQVLLYMAVTLSLAMSLVDGEYKWIAFKSFWPLYRCCRTEFVRYSRADCYLAQPQMEWGWVCHFKCVVSIGYQWFSMGWQVNLPGANKTQYRNSSMAISALLHVYDSILWLRMNSVHEQYSPKEPNDKDVSTSVKSLLRRHHIVHKATCRQGSSFLHVHRFRGQTHTIL